MSYFQAIVIGLLQGVTELFPALDRSLRATAPNRLFEGLYTE